MKYFKNICLVFLSWLCVSCADQIVYHSYEHFSKEGWHKSDTISLDLHITDSISGQAEIIFLLRNQTDYLYRDFHVTVQHNLPDTSQWKYYNLDFILADKDGRWSGSGLGGLYESSASLGEAYISQGVYTFKIIHQMNDECLTGISDIGILVKKEKPKQP